MAAAGGYAGIAIKGKEQQGIPATPNCPSRAAGAVAATDTAGVVNGESTTI